jgi:hypothetical protein
MMNEEITVDPLVLILHSDFDELSRVAFIVLHSPEIADSFAPIR